MNVISNYENVGEKIVLPIRSIWTLTMQITSLELSTTAVPSPSSAFRKFRTPSSPVCLLAHPKLGYAARHRALATRAPPAKREPCPATHPVRSEGMENGFQSTSALFCDEIPPRRSGRFGSTGVQVLHTLTRSKSTTSTSKRAGWGWTACTTHTQPVRMIRRFPRPSPQPVTTKTTAQSPSIHMRPTRSR